MFKLNKKFIIIIFNRKFDTLCLDNQSDKDEEIHNIDKPEENTKKEMEAEEKRNAFSVNKEPKELLTNTSGDSSTDTLIPNSDLLTNGEKET